MLVYLPKEEIGKEFILTKGAGASLVLFETEQWKNFQGELMKLDKDDRNVRLFRRHVIGSAQQSSTDEEGAIFISDCLYYYCSVKQEGEQPTLYKIQDYIDNGKPMFRIMEKYVKYVISSE